MDTLENKIRIQRLLLSIEQVNVSLIVLKKFRVRLDKDMLEKYTEEEILQFEKDKATALKCKSFLYRLGNAYNQSKFNVIKHDIIRQFAKEIDFNFKIEMIIEDIILQTYRLWVVTMILSRTKEGVVTYDMLKSMSIDEMEEYHDKLIEQPEKKEKKGLLSLFF